MSSSVDCGCFHISLVVQKQTDQLCPALEAEQGQCLVAVGLDLSLDVWAHVQRQIDCRDMASHGSQPQRRDTQCTSSPERKQIQWERNTGKGETCGQGWLYTHTFKIIQSLLTHLCNLINIIQKSPSKSLRLSERCVFLHELCLSPPHPPLSAFPICGGKRQS